MLCNIIVDVKAKDNKIWKIQKIYRNTLQIRKTPGLPLHNVICIFQDVDNKKEVEDDRNFVSLLEIDFLGSITFIYRAFKFVCRLSTAKPTEFSHDSRNVA
jgi:hypothetical protein